jgi:uncharacterized protein involved in exopolysaccharide biosynthesis
MDAFETMNNQVQGQSPRPHGYDDEISLVDLASILVKRWKAMAVIFAVIVLAALAYALMMPRTYSYTSLYGVAEQGPDNALEAPEALVAKAQNLYLGPETRKLLASMDSELEVLPFETSISNTEKTLLVSVSSEAAEDDAELIDQLHNNVLARLQDGQKTRVESSQKSLQRQLEDAQETLDTTQQSNSNSLSNAAAISSLMERIAGLKNSLANIREGEVLQTTVRSLLPTGTGPGRKLILALGIVLGGLLAVMGAFFMQFAGLVRASLKEEG